jgi:hypothetical protein
LSFALVVAFAPSGAALPDRARAADVEPPTLIAPVETIYLDAYDHVALWLSEPIDVSSIPDQTDFAVTVGGVPQTVSDINLVYQGLVGAPPLVDVGLPGGLAFIEVRWETAIAAPPGAIEISYSAGTHPLRDLAGNELANFTDQEAVLLDFPVFVGAVDEGTGPDRLVLFASWVMAGIPDADDFSVEIGVRGSFIPLSRTQLQPDAGATFISLELPTSVLAGEAVTLTYVPDTNPLRDQNGDLIGSFSGMPISVSVATAPTRATPASTLAEPIVTVSPADATTGAALVSLSFDNVLTAGTTTLTTSLDGPALPGALSLGDPPMFFDLDTDATFDGEVEICISYGLVDFPDPTPNLVLLHYSGGAWVEVPQTFWDPAAQVVCGRVTSLSPFTVAASDYQFIGFLAPVDNSPTTNRAKAGSVVPVRFGLGGSFGLGIFSPGFPQVRRVDCLNGEPTDQIEETITAGASSLSYISGTGRYQYTWKTDKAWAGTCRELILVLGDTTRHVARFNFTR